MTAIEWTHVPGYRGASWNPFVGCAVVSPGCKHCYAMKQASRIERINAATGFAPHYAGTTETVNGKPVWTGRVNLAPVAKILEPLATRRPTAWFVNSMSDFGAEEASDAARDLALSVMVRSPRHLYQILTKRPERLAAYLAEPATWDRVAAIVARESSVLNAQARRLTIETPVDPRRHIWIGASVEDEKRSSDRRESMRRLAALGWTTFVSYEPALGPVDWSGWEFLDWLIAGGESGPGARPAHPDWIRAARDFCRAHGIPFFFKQWGAWLPVGERCDDDGQMYRVPDDGGDPSRLVGRVTGRRATVSFSGQTMLRVGKGLAGALLDGVEWRCFPYPKNAPFASAHDFLRGI